MYGFISQAMVLVLSTTIILTPLATALPTFLWFSLCASPSSPGWNLYLQDVFYLQEHRGSVATYLPAKSIKKSSVLKISPSPALATSFLAIVDFPLKS